MKFSRHPTDRTSVRRFFKFIYCRCKFGTANGQWRSSGRIPPEFYRRPPPIMGFLSPSPFLTSRNEGSGEVVSQTSAITFRLSAARCNSHETQLPLCAMRKPNSAINSVEAGRERRIERGQGSFRAFSRFFSRRTQQARHELKGGLRPSRRPLSPRVFCSIFFRLRTRILRPLLPPPSLRFMA